VFSFAVKLLTPACFPALYQPHIWRMGMVVRAWLYGHGSTIAVPPAVPFGGKELFLIVLAKYCQPKRPHSPEPPEIRKGAK
jgi:hypothetical protein